MTIFSDHLTNLLPSTPGFRSHNTQSLSPSEKKSASKFSGSGIFQTSASIRQSLTACSTLFSAFKYLVHIALPAMCLFLLSDLVRSAQWDMSQTKTLTRYWALIFQRRLHSSHSSPSTQDLDKQYASFTLNMPFLPCAHSKLSISELSRLKTLEAKLRRILVGSCWPFRSHLHPVPSCQY